MKRLLLALAATLLLTMPGVAAEPTGTLKKIKDSGTITVGYRENSSPFSSVGEDKQPVGYSIDLCQRVVSVVKTELGLGDLAVKYVPLTAENRFDAVASGTVDIHCGNTTNTLSRQKTVDFSNMTFVTGASFLVGSDSGINSLEDLAGKKVAVAKGTTTETALQTEIKKRLIDATIVPVDDHKKGLEALEGGQVAAYAGDRVILIGLGRESKDPSKLMLAQQLFTYEPYGLVVRRNDADFRLAVNTALAQVYRSGEIARIYEKWFGAWGGRPSRLLLAMFALNSLPE